MNEGPRFSSRPSHRLASLGGRLLLAFLVLAATAACGNGNPTGTPELTPVITISGVQDGETRSTPATITIDTDRGTYSATLDGLQFTSGSTVTVAGTHTLVVTARNATATATREVTFAIVGRVPSKGTPRTLDMATWNLEWFGDPSNGPPDQHLQLINVSDVIAGTDVDLWAVQEVVSVVYFDSLLASLPGYAGVLANDPRVVGGSAYYSPGEQKLGVVFKAGLASLLSARAILASNETDFAGRPPLELRLRLTLNGASEDVVVIVLHMKAFADLESYQRRAAAAGALKSYLDTTWPTQKVWVLGDWNDDLDQSITPGQASPFVNFNNDQARYRFPTLALTEGRLQTTTGFPDPIDHHLVTNEAFASLLQGSVEAYRLEAFVAGYGNTTSDHYPVLTRYSFGN